MHIFTLIIEYYKCIKKNLHSIEVAIAKIACMQAQRKKSFTLIA